MIRHTSALGMLLCSETYLIRLSNDNILSVYNLKMRALGFVLHTVFRKASAIRTFNRRQFYSYERPSDICLICDVISLRLFPLFVHTTSVCSSPVSSCPPRRSLKLCTLSIPNPAPPSSFSTF